MINTKEIDKKILMELLKLEYFETYNFLYCFYNGLKIEITMDINNILTAKIIFLNISPQKITTIKFVDSKIDLSHFKKITVKEYILQKMKPEKKIEFGGDTYFSLNNGKEMDNQFICSHCGNHELYYNTSSCEVMDQACEDSVSIDLLVKYCPKCATVFVKEN